MTFKQPYLLIVFISFFFFSCNEKKEYNLNNSELDTISFVELSIKSYEYLNEQQKFSDSLYKISSYENWFFDQTKGELTFSDSGIKKLIIDYEDVGSLSFKSNTWLWSWDNPTVEQKIKSQLSLVKDYGIRRNFRRLKIPKWQADEYDSWEMTAISAYLLKAKGAYRVPSKDSSLRIFMIYKNIRWADSLKSH